jgi:hypothetical protein
VKRLAVDEDRREIAVPSFDAEVPQN